MNHRALLGIALVGSLLLAVATGCEYPAITVPRDARGDAVQLDVQSDGDSGGIDVALDQQQPDVVLPVDDFFDVPPDMPTDVQPDLAIIDVPPDTPCPGMVCMGRCIDTTMDTTNCGGCGTTCPGATGARATCAMSACGYECVGSNLDCDSNRGNGCEVDGATSRTHCGRCGNACGASDTCVGGTCMPVGVTRLIGPMSTSIVTSRRPRLRWALGANADSARVQLCRDRACTMEIASVTGATEAMPTSDLPVGVVFWRAFSRRGAFEVSTPSATWEFFVGARSAPVNTANGSVLDVNGDGFADVAVGAPLATFAGMMSCGVVYIHFGGPGGISTTPSQTFGGPAAGSQIGGNLASAGDVNGDGFGDLIVGPRLIGSQTVVIFFGSRTGLTSGRTLDPAPSLNGVVSAVTGLGDFDGDGYGDVAASAASASPGGMTSAGAVHLYYGGDGGPAPTPMRSILGTGTMGFFGLTMHAGGDLNGDGRGDIAIGYRHNATGGTAARGRVGVWFGRSSALPAAPDFEIEGTDSVDNFGSAIATAGDFNADGYAELVVGARSAAPTGLTGAGSVRVYAGSSAGPTFPAQTTLDGASTGDNFGVAVISAGDTNGDGFSDLFVGADGVDSGVESSAGAMYVYPGSTGGLMAPGNRFVLGGPSVLGIGRVIATGDVNGDTRSDVWTTASGTVRVFAGRGGVPAGTPMTILMNPDATAMYGQSIAVLDQSTLDQRTVDQRLFSRSIGALGHSLWNQSLFD